MECRCNDNRVKLIQKCADAGKVYEPDFVERLEFLQDLVFELYGDEGLQEAKNLRGPHPQQVR